MLSFDLFVIYTNRLSRMERNPKPENEALRLQALRDYGILDTINDEEFDRLAELAALICGAPIALISLIDDDRQWIKSKVGLSQLSETTREDSFCQYTIMGNETFLVGDATKDDRFVNNPYVIGDPDIRFYAGYPLKDPNGFNLGSLCVIDQIPRNLTDVQLKALEVLAKEVVSKIISKKENIERNKLEKLFNCSRDLICIVGTDGLFKKLNPGVINILKYSEEELLNTPFMNLVHPDDVEETRAEFGKLKDGIVAIDFQNRYVQKDGNIVTLNWLTNPDLESGDFYAIARDVTVKEKVLKELEEAKLVSQKAVKVKDEFLSNMSHEIRTPLNAIIGFNDLLKQTPLNSDQEKYVEIVRVASQNLMVIINDILDISKLESGKLELDERPIRIREIAEGVIHLHSQKAKAKGLKLLLSIDQDIPMYVTGDSTRISQVLTNLIGNAIKFTEKGFIEVKLFEKSRQDNNTQLCFSVKDTGIGIEESKQNLIFERFSQAENSTTRLFGGTGLGLNISKMILSLYNSKIDVKSELGQGTEFSFELSLPILTMDGVSSVFDVPNSKSDNLLAGRLVLVAEDNEHNQILATTYLKKNGAEVEIAENGAIAVEKLKNKNFDLVLMDLQMPVMDGFEATKSIRNDLKSDLPIIACSAHSLVGERENCLEKGMNEYISKPYSEKTLVRILTSFLSKKTSTNVSTDQPLVESLIELDDFGQILTNMEYEFGSEFVNMMLEVYRRRIPSDISNLEKAIRNSDMATIQSSAHLLVGSLSSLNFEIGSNLAKSIEANSKKNKIEEVTFEVSQLILYLNKSLETLRKNE